MAPARGSWPFRFDPGSSANSRQPSDSRDEGDAETQGSGTRRGRLRLRLSASPRLTWRPCLAGGNALANPILAQFVASYNEPGNFYDWGDDPGFFCARHFLGDCRLAGWGVCRPDVRAALAPGDFVVFFCARWAPERVWRYYYIGVATMKEGVSRSEIWTDPCLAAYRRFYNVLARLEDGKLVHHEAMTRHDDWQHRASTPYLLFDADLTDVDLDRPPHVATYDPRLGPVEVWRRADPHVRELEELLFVERGIRRRLRTHNTQQPHRHINLTNFPADRSFDELSRELRKRVRQLP